MAVDYYDRSGNPMSHDEWVNTWTQERQRVAWDTKNDVRVSTIWLGIDHQYADGPPLIFETMIFGGDHDGEQWRDSTEDEALESHKHACEVAGLVMGDTDNERAREGME